jgi:hypothetical protein
VTIIVHPRNAHPSYDRRIRSAIIEREAPPLPQSTLLALAAALARQVNPDFLDLDSEGARDYRRLIRTDAFEAWVIPWGSSSFLGLHDHGGSNGAFHIVEGELTEVYSDLTTRTALETRRVRPGSQQAFGPEHVHEIWNEHAFSVVSIHVYSPPLSHVNFFEHDDAHFLDLERTETRADWSTHAG